MAGSEFIFQTAATNVGGPEGVSYLGDGSFSTKVTHPPELGGSGEGLNPGNFLALGYSTSFNFTLARIMKAEGLDGEPMTTTTVELQPDSSDNGFKLAVRLEVAIKGMERGKVQALADRTHAACPYSKAMKNNVDVTIAAVVYESLA
ncbi:Ohr family peroxiredoxin [Planomicrobium sp. CPCC 101110]|uniref:Ohr family peroxiredoxin n=1 Tax=Planomicrobium sp. CPCC 101110 TaxID=2599619 RepID=UPI0011B75A77|nr:Ohr family peroxiredoxin [Planomicrobium sp. CPCC 101110]TWT25180.1 Ohr family peroxiredoxin [Planomicrobium sp. CPCC 101110]